MMEITIRQEEKTDHAAVFEVNSLAFGRDNEAKLTDLLRQGNSFVPELSLVATAGQKIVGHILFTEISIVHADSSETRTLALAPMAVLPGYQHRGTGGRLIQQGLAKAKELQYRSVIVLGHKNYYPAHGFMPAGKWNIRCPFNVPPDAFMAIELVNGALENAGGLVKYPKEFEMV